MPDLSQIFPPNDLGFTRIVASLWGVDLTSSDPVAASVELAEALCDAELVDEVVSTLSKDGRAALEALAAAGGRIPWGTFSRRFGDVREMGPGKRDREQPHLHPSSAAETLWYRALVGKAFFDTEKGSQEFAFIPDDFLMVLDFADSGEEKIIHEVHEVDEEEQKEVLKPKPMEEKQKSKAMPRAEVAPRVVVPAAPRPITPAARPVAPIPEPVAPNETEDALGRPASPAEKAFPTPGSDRLLDDACTLLAALRTGIQPSETRIPVSVVSAFLEAAKIVVNGVPQPDPVKSFLEASRPKALEMLVGAWQDSESFNELRMVPGLSCEGEWKNQPLETREFLLNLLEAVPEKQWWSLPAFVRDVKAKYPDFQRPAGDYDSWFIKRESDGSFLRGFASWDNVDGALIRYFVGGPLFWLGMLDLAAPEENAAPTAFRATNSEYQLANGENAKLSVASNGRISVPRLVPRAARYQIARFCEWEPEKDDEYRYRVTPDSLARARKQGLKSEHLVGILRKYAAAPLPPPFVRALQRWEVNGTEARIEQLVVLKVSKPEVLNELRASNAGRFLGEVLGPVTVVVKAGAQAKVLAALAEMGLLAEGQVEE
jgi:hypothetical protein